MTVAKPTVSIDREVYAAAKAAARQAGVSFSAWIEDAAARKLRKDRLLDLVSEWEAEHGPITAAEEDTARAELGLAVGPRAHVRRESA